MVSIELSIPAFIIGVIFLWKSSDILVEGTSKTAARLGVSTLIISLVIVAFGTSAPEFAISFGAALQSNANISIGNIIGSCIANILLVLGISALIKPIKIKKSIIRKEIPILIGTTFIFLIFSYFGLLDTYHVIGGLIFLILFVFFIVYCILTAKKQHEKTKKQIDPGKTMKNIIFIILGIAGVVFGAWLLIESAVAIADFFGISKLVIALSMVAIGTSLPELVVSSVASYKGQADIAVGNIIGSNIFNILLILGASALLISLEASESIILILILLIVSLILLPFCCTDHAISRKEGIIFLIIYAFYIWFIFPH